MATHRPPRRQRRRPRPAALIASRSSNPRTRRRTLRDWVSLLALADIAGWLIVPAVHSISS